MLTSFLDASKFTMLETREAIPGMSEFSVSSTLFYLLISSPGGGRDFSTTISSKSKACKNGQWSFHGSTSCQQSKEEQNFWQTFHSCYTWVSCPIKRDTSIGTFPGLRSLLSPSLVNFFQ